MSDPITNREVESVLFRLRSPTHDKRIGPWIAEDFQGAADLLERLQRRVLKLEADIEAAYTERKEIEE